MTPKQIAKICHEANRAYCEELGDGSQLPWADAADWQKDSAEKGVQFALSNPDLTAEDQHWAWCDDKVAAGWVYGPVKDADAKTHPCLLPYDGLPQAQQGKDALFRGIVLALRPLLI